MAGSGSMGGSGRADMSGNGFAEWNELGVEVTRWDGGHSRSGGSSSFFLVARCRDVRRGG